MRITAHDNVRASCTMVTCTLTFRTYVHALHLHAFRLLLRSLDQANAKQRQPAQTLANEGFAETASSTAAKLHGCTVHIRGVQAHQHILRHCGVKLAATRERPLWRCSERQINHRLRNRTTGHNSRIGAAAATRTYTHTHTHTHTHADTHRHTQTHTHRHARTHAHTHTQAHTQARTQPGNHPFCIRASVTTLLAT